MVARGWVKNGVVVLDPGAQLPEGEEVTVLMTNSEPAADVQPDADRPSDSHLATTIRSHSLLDILPVSLGVPLKAVTPEADVLGEMLEERS